MKPVNGDESFPISVKHTKKKHTKKWKRNSLSIGKKQSLSKWNY